MGNLEAQSGSAKKVAGRTLSILGSVLLWIGTPLGLLVTAFGVIRAFDYGSRTVITTSWVIAGIGLLFAITALIMGLVLRAIGKSTAASGASQLKGSLEKKKCPYCSEEIIADARKCKHCGEFLEQ